MGLLGWVVTMTVRLNSFDESQHGAFVESSLHARNTADLYGIMFLLNGAGLKYYGWFEAEAQRDLEIWNAFLELHPTASALVVAFPVGDHAPIWAPGVPWPRRIERLNTTFPLSPAVVDRIYERTTSVASRKPKRIQIKISGGTERSREDIEPEFTRLLEKLESAGWIYDVHEGTYAAWLAALRDNLVLQKS